MDEQTEIAQKSKRKIINSLIALFNILFLLIWWRFSWGEEVELFKPGWWFDAYGHALTGFGWAWIVLYWSKLYSPDNYVFDSKFRTARDVIFKVIIGEIFLWEIGVELLWDSQIQPNFASWMAKAQKGAADNMFDVAFTALAAALAMILWGLYRKYYAWRYPNEAAQEEINEENARLNIIAKRILAQRKEQQKQTLRKFLLHFRKPRDKSSNPAST